MEYLNARYLERNSERFEYNDIYPSPGTDINDKRLLTLVSTSLNQLELPCHSYLYVEGRLLKADGTPFTKVGNVYPDITLTNNFFPYLYSNITYLIDGIPVEDLFDPGMCTTINTIITNPKPFNGLEMCWSIDTDDGRTDSQNSYIYYPIPTVTADNLPITNTSPANYRTGVKGLANYFNAINPHIGLEIQDTDLPAAADPATRAEILTGMNNIIVNKLRPKVSNAPIELLADEDIPAGDVAVASIRGAVNALIKRINRDLILKTIPSLTSKNNGFSSRKNLLFNPVGSIMDPADAGRFTFSIPLSHIFNFCNMFKYGIYGVKHELRLTRQTDDFAIYKYGAATPLGMVKLDKLIWFMPRLTLNTDARLETKKLILENKTMIPVDFMGKCLHQHPVITGVNRQQFKYDMPNINSIRYVVLVVQVRDKTVCPTLQDFNHSIINDPYTARINSADISCIKAKVGGKSFYIDSFTNNGAANNFAAQYYHEFKKLRVDYLNDYTETDMISYSDFINLYRLYCINVSCHEAFTTGTSSEVNLDVTFTRPLPAADQAETGVYTVTYFDSEFELQSDGKRQFCKQKAYK